jgi:hypothetical protein
VIAKPQKPARKADLRKELRSFDDIFGACDRQGEPSTLDYLSSADVDDTLEAP